MRDRSGYELSLECPGSLYVVSAQLGVRHSAEANLRTRTRRRCRDGSWAAVAVTEEVDRGRGGRIRMVVVVRVGQA